MFGNQIEDQYANSISLASANARGASYWPIILFLNFGIALLIVWAYFYEIEEVTTGTGKVIPSSQLQKVQSLEGGIVSEIAVREGQEVEAGQVLMNIDATNFASRLGEVTGKEVALRAERIRLLAEAAEAEVLEFPPELMSEAPTSVAAENEVFNSRRKQLAGELQVLDDRLRQRRAELTELAARENKLRSQLAPLSREAELTRRLFRRGVVPEVDYLRLSSQVAEIRGDLEVVQAEVPKIEASIEEAQNQIQTTRNTYALTARERLATLEGELAVVRETMKAATDRVTRTELRSPVRGIVNRVNTSTVGAVVQPGQDLVEIVPIDDGLLIEASIRPQDVAFIRPGEEASVKLTAYDYLIYGALKGKIDRIGADTIADANGEQFFKVIVRTEKNHLGTEENKLPIIPGMVASVDLQTGRNTVLTYLMKPLLRAQGEALRER
ncbi:HlyD family type I secretion periplasmic adaptor subunit [Pseudahrensia aquimaris]|uniref:Membrane fusion protein (MFP) family protein n=1 Tax=Pseudahrensia aquimaris TaxID=744461 RepID=A0ABW3F9H0_9HYPH